MTTVQTTGRLLLQKAQLGMMARTYSTASSQAPTPTQLSPAASHDRFPGELAVRVFGADAVEMLRGLECCAEDLNLTHVGLMLSHYVSGVTQRHGQMSQSMFPSYPIGSITNGVHAGTWTSPAFGELFDRTIPGWRNDNFSLRYAFSIPRAEIAAAHLKAKRALVDAVRIRTGVSLAPDAVEVLRAYRWPANVREPRNVLDLAVLLPDRAELRAEHLRLDAAGQGPGAAQAAVTLLAFIMMIGITVWFCIVTAHIVYHALAPNLMMSLGWALVILVGFVLMAMSFGHIQ